MESTKNEVFAAFALPGLSKQPNEGALSEATESVQIHEREYKR
jgi:hypothetical protein